MNIGSPATNSSTRMRIFPNRTGRLSMPTVHDGPPSFIEIPRLVITKEDTAPPSTPKAPRMPLKVRSMDNFDGLRVLERRARRRFPIDQQEDKQEVDQARLRSVESAPKFPVGQAGFYVHKVRSMDNFDGFRVKDKRARRRSPIYQQEDKQEVVQAPLRSVQSAPKFPARQAGFYVKEHQEAAEAGQYPLSCSISATSFSDSSEYHEKIISSLDVLKGLEGERWETSPGTGRKLRSSRVSLPSRSSDTALDESDKSASLPRRPCRQESFGKLSNRGGRSEKRWSNSTLDTAGEGSYNSLVEACKATRRRSSRTIPQMPRRQKSDLFSGFLDCADSTEREP